MLHIHIQTPLHPLSLTCRDARCSGLPLSGYKSPFQFWLVLGAVIAAVVVAGLNVLIPKLLGELIDVLAKMGVLGGRGDSAAIRGATDNGAGDNAGFQWVSTEFLAKIKGPSIVLIGMTD